jgi:hypothetical protein
MHQGLKRPIEMAQIHGWLLLKGCGAFSAGRSMA